MTQEEFFKRYTIDLQNGRLGGGAFGTVYKAYDNLKDIWVAIKIAEVKILNEKKYSLIDEIKALNELPTHRNIANYEAVYQFNMPNGIFDYAIMQYYSAGNLKELLDKGSLSESQKLQILLGTLQGIAALHDHQVIHRDLKPSNILISITNNGQFIPKITDFGLAKIIEAEKTDITNSITGGTLEYASPEQLYGLNLLKNSDLWSFGVIAFEIFTKKKPFYSDNTLSNSEEKRSEIYRKIVDAVLPDEIKLCPFPWNIIIRECLKRDPQERIEDAHKLIEILRNPENIDTKSPLDDSSTVLLGSKTEKKIVLPADEKTNALKEELTLRDYLKKEQNKKIDQHESLGLKKDSPKKTPRKKELKQNLKKKTAPSNFKKGSERPPGSKLIIQAGKSQGATNSLDQKRTEVKSRRIKIKQVHKKKENTASDNTASQSSNQTQVKKATNIGSEAGKIFFIMVCIILTILIIYLTL